MIYFTSDLHFGHANVIQFCNRPFSSVREMDETLIENWNSTVSDNDSIYVIGDFSFYKKEQTSEIFKKLKGKKHLIKGNHDGHDTVKLPWMWVKEQGHIDKPYIWMNHFPKKSWNRSYHDSYHVFGHIHGNGNYWADGLSCDVGVDMWDYKPVSLDVLESFFSRLKLIQAKCGYFMWKGKPLDKIEYVCYNDLDKLKHNEEK
jgi:calcineurin-like phosphoesterase family protein